MEVQSQGAVKTNPSSTHYSSGGTVVVDEVIETEQSVNLSGPWQGPWIFLQHLEPYRTPCNKKRVLSYYVI